MKSLLIRETATVKEAMKALNASAKNGLIVVNADGVLLGMLTDGDIRRFILKSNSLDSAIGTAYNKDPQFISKDNFDLEQVKEIMLRLEIDIIPIVDENRVVVDFINWESAFGDEPTINKKIDAMVVIMAGGKGTRMEPFTLVLPKPLIPIQDKPIIEHIIETFLGYGIMDYYLTVNYKAQIMKAYFQERNPDYQVHFIEENKPLGTAGSLKLLESSSPKPIIVSNCDILIKTDMWELTQFHLKGEYDLTLVASLKHYRIPYGICELNEKGHLDHIKEKPEYQMLVNTGLYVLDPGVLKLIPDDEFMNITTLMDMIKKNGGKVGVYPVGEDDWIDIGQWQEYKNTLHIFGD